MHGNSVSSPPLNTFIVRVWRDTDSSGGDWRGYIYHVQSGERIALADERDLLNFLRRWMPRVSARTTPDKPTCLDDLSPHKETD